MSQAVIETKNNPWWAATGYYVNFEDTKGNKVRKQISKDTASLFMILNKYTKDSSEIKFDKRSELMNDSKNISYKNSYVKYDDEIAKRKVLMFEAIADFTDKNSEGESTITENEIKMWYERIIK